jgi:hypothetical protein
MHGSALRAAGDCTQRSANLFWPCLSDIRSGNARSFDAACHGIQPFAAPGS